MIKDQFYCIGSRPEAYGEINDLVVLYVTDEAETMDEARAEFRETGKNIILPGCPFSRA